MKLSLISALVAGAGLAQVAAAPIRLVVITKTSERFPAVPDNVATVRLGDGPHMIPHVVPTRKMRPGCNGRMNRFKQKGIEISNAFRQALGLPLIEASSPNPGGPVGSGEFHILPLLPVSPEIQHDSFGSVRVSNLPHRHPHHGPPPNVPGPHLHHRPHHHVIHNSSFTNRLHHSLMHLGRWEGRAVAFVLGCGIGVLLRMFWVLAIVLYRSIKGSDEPENEYAHLTIIEDFEDEVISAPPTYTYSVDQKLAIAPETTVEAK